MFDLLQTVAFRHPGVGLRVWIDDITQRVEGPKDIIIGKLSSAAITIAGGFAEIGLYQSDKIVAIASDFEIAKAVAKEIQDAGFKCKPAKTAADHGIDRGSRSAIRARKFKGSARRKKSSHQVLQGH